MTNKYIILKTLHTSTSLILSCVAFVALITLFNDLSSVMSMGVVPDDISEELTEIFMMLTFGVFFGSSALINIMNMK